MSKAEIKAIKCGKLIDGTGAKPIENAMVVIEDSKVKTVGKDIEAPQGAKVIDAAGKTVMPGLIDSHMHHMGTETENLETVGIVRPRELALIKSIYDSKGFLEAGFTTAKDCGGINAVYLREAKDEGLLTGLPRIVAAGHTLSQTFGHADPHYLPTEYVDPRTTKHAGFLMTLLCDGIDECIKATRYNLRCGADFIKVMATGGWGVSKRDHPSNVNFNIDEISAIVQTAEQAGRFVTAHCHNARGAKNSILGGIKTIDHVTEINDDLVNLAKENGTIFVSTLAIYKAVLDSGSQFGTNAPPLEPIKTEFVQTIESYKRIHQAGAVLAAGSDYVGTRLLPLDKCAIELELLVKYCDFTPMEAIVAATKNGAMACFIGDRTGTIEPGKFADIIIVDGDPLTDIKILQDKEKIKVVMLEGKVEVDRGL